MANWFVDSASGGTNSGTAANPWASLASATAGNGVAAGDTIFVGDDHAESQASALTCTFPGTASNPNFIYCVDHTKFATPPGSGDLKTTGTVTTTGNNGISLQGAFYMYGLTFNMGTGANVIPLILGSGTTGAANTQKYEACAFDIVATGASFISMWNQAGGIGYMEWVNTTVTFGAVGQSIAYGNGRFRWRNTPSAIGGSTFPTNLFFASVDQIDALLEGVDLSALGSGKNIVQAGVAGSGSIQLKDCKLNASVTIASAPTTSQGCVATYVTRSDSAGTNYVEQCYKYEGTQKDELTIVRAGGASDGTTQKSRKIVTTSHSKWVLPFECIPMVIWNDGTSPRTVTVYGTTTGGGVPNDDDIWIDVEYLGSASSPQGSFVTSTKANNLAASAAVNNSSDSSTWGGGGAGNGFKIVSPSFTPGQKGYIYVYVKAAKASTTWYIDPTIN